MERWRSVSVCPKYEVSDGGRVRHVRTGRIKSPTIRDDGYVVVALTLSTKRSRTFLLHRLVLFAFTGKPPSEKHEGAHWDGDKTNNALSNLRWATPLENKEDQRRHGRFFVPDGRGERNGRAKLTEVDVLAIRARRNAGETYRAIAADYGLTPPAVRYACTGENWGHVNAG